jgi:predicted outer membrane protein
MILTIALGLTSSIFAYRLYVNEKRSQDYIKEFDRLNRHNADLDEMIWSMKIELQQSKTETVMAKMEHEKTKQELEDKIQTWQNQFTQLKNVESKGSKSDN